MITFFVECMLLSMVSERHWRLSAYVHAGVVVPMLLYHEQIQSDPCTLEPAENRPV